MEHAEDTSNFDTFEVKPEEIFGNLNGNQKAYNPAFFDFTFRHFFDYESGQPNPVSRAQQRPSIAPLIELSESQKKNELLKMGNGHASGVERKEEVKSPKQSFLSRVTNNLKTDKNRNLVKPGESNPSMMSQMKNRVKIRSFLNNQPKEKMYHKEHIQEEDEDSDGVIV